MGGLLDDGTIKNINYMNSPASTDDHDKGWTKDPILGGGAVAYG